MTNSATLEGPLGDAEEPLAPAALGIRAGLRLVIDGVGDADEELCPGSGMLCGKQCTCYLQQSIL